MQDIGAGGEVFDGEGVGEAYAFVTEYGDAVGVIEHQPCGTFQPLSRHGSRQANGKREDDGFLQSFLFLKIYPFDAWGDGGEHLVGDGACGCGIALQEVSLAEEDDGVALVAFHTSNVDETHVHADAADDGHFVAGDDDMPLLVAEVAVEAVGVADGDDGDARRSLGYPAAVVAHRVAERDVLDLRDAGDQAPGAVPALRAREPRRRGRCRDVPYPSVLRGSGRCQRN